MKSINLTTAIFLMVSPLLSESQSVSTYCDTIYGESNYIVRTTINVLDSARLVSSYCSIESKYYNEKLAEKYNQVLLPKNLQFGNSFYLTNGLYISYYENGSYREISNYILGRKYGMAIMFYPNGQIKEYGSYGSFENISKFEIDSTTTIEYDAETFEEISRTVKEIVSKKTGPWFYFTSDGNLISVEYY
ncbi:MAG: hypothetical protein R2767_01940 [Chitinophagales bacterium]